MLTQSVRLIVAVCLAQLMCVVDVARAQAPLRKIGEMELSLLGLNAAPDPVNPAVPKSTPTALRIAVRAGGGGLAVADVARFLGPDFEIRGELAGPGLASTVSLTQPAPGSSLLLPLPALTTAGTYTISNLRILAGGRTALDVAPSRVELTVLEQILITSVVTRPLTLQEIKDKGIVLEKDDVIGFDFTLALKLESTPIQVSFPVVFDRQGVPVPTGLLPPALTDRVNVDVPSIVPMMLSVEDASGLNSMPTLLLPDGRTVDVKIPALLVIPGNTGFLKQFFSAQLYVQNGAPGGTNLVVHNVTGTIALPNGDDALPHTADDPLSLPATKAGPQRLTQPVVGVGPDGLPGTADDDQALSAGETGQVEFLLRGDKEGFHSIGFDINATLEGLPTGPIAIKGHAAGGVLVRNPFFDVTFTAPSVARRGEPFTLNMTLTNIGGGAANALTVALDASRMSGTHVSGPSSKTIDTIAPGESQSLKFSFISDRTGQVVAHYLRFDPLGAEATGQVNFTVGVGERGVPLSPDTLVLPAVVDALPTTVVDAAMRVLGQAWSVANAPAGSLPVTVIRTTKASVTHKALALAEAGLRATLGQPVGDALRDFGVDFYGGAPLDNGFDQLLRTTDAGRELAATLGAALGTAAAVSGGPLEWQRALSNIAASGPDLVSFVVAGSGAPPAALTVSDASGHRATPFGDSEANAAARSEIRSAALLPLGDPAFAPIAGLITAPTASPYTLSFTGGGPGGAVDLSVSLPRGDGRVVHGTITGAALGPATRARVVIDPARADSLTLDEDADGDGVFETSVPFALETLAPAGPRAIAVAVIGPETLAEAQPFGFNLAVLFDRATDADSAANAANFVIPKNTVVGSHRQLSGRLVFASLARPEGPYVATTMAISNITDNHGVVGPSVTLPVTSRLLDAGAVIRGRVISADGTPVSSGVVTYLGNKDYLTCAETDSLPFSAIPLGADGRFELHYVRQDACGYPWVIAANDPVTGALRQISARVMSRGEQIEADIVLFGRGSVTGVVRDLSNHPVPGATVIALHATDLQSFGQAITDGDGRYTIPGLTVGTVNVRAYKGISGGRTTGNVPRAGGTGTANLTLDGGTVNVHGIVRQVDGATAAPLPGAIVVYYLRDSGRTAVGVTTTKSDGSYSILALPVGSFEVEAILDAATTGSVQGIAAAGDQLTEDVAIIVHQTVTVHGHVILPDATPAANTVVTIAQRGVLTEVDGSFAIPGVPVLPYAQEVIARSRDGLRSGRNTVTVVDAVHPVPNVLIALSGVGSVDFLVVDPLGNPLPGQPVAITVPCPSSCGCAQRIGVTGIDGRVKFLDLAVGPVTATAVRLVGGFGDEARISTSIPRDGETVFGTLRFPGFGVVTGTVLGPDGRPAEGADVSLQSSSFGENACGLRFGPSQTVRTDVNGRFRFAHVNLGPVGVTTTHPFFDTTVGTTSTLTTHGQQVDVTLTLVDTVAGQLSGTIFMPDKVTPAGAGVQVSITGSLPEVIVSTDAQGYYRFAKIFPKGGYRIIVRDPATGFGGYEDVYLNTGQDQIHDIRMKGQGTVRVHVVDGADQPVTSAYVTLQGYGIPASHIEMSLDPSNQGVATFEHVFEGYFSLTVTDAFGRGARPAATLPGSGQTIDVTARLTTTGTVRGHFYAADGTTPVPFGIVQLLEYSRYGVIGAVTAEGSGDVGAFSFTHVPAGPIRVRGTDPLTGRSGIGVGTLTTEGEEVVLNVVAQGIGTIQGLVTSNGAPQPGAHVTITSGQYSAGTMTDADGRYLVTGVPEGPVVVAGSLGDRFLQGITAATLAGDGTTLTLDVALHDSGEIDGLLVQSDGVTPGPIAVITAQSGGYGGGTQSVTSDLAGGFHFDRVASGLASLTADVVGTIDQGALSVSVPAAGTAQVTLTLNGVGAIDGTVTDSLGQPVAGTIVITGTGAARYSLTVTASIDGQFHLPEVLAGPFTAKLSATVNGLPLYGSGSGVVTPNQHTAIAIALQDSGTITGVVLRPDGTTPAIGAAITIQLTPWQRGALNVQTQADGHFTVTGVPLGAFDALVFDAGSSGVARTINQQIAHNGDTVTLGTMVLDTRPFSVISIDPPDGATNVQPRDPFTVVLSAAVDTPGGIKIRDTQGGTYGFFPYYSADGKTLTVAGLQNPEGRDLVLELSPDLRDMFGRHLLQTVASHFHTRDITPPTVSAVSPLSQAIQIPVSSVVSATFSEPISTTGLATLIVVTGPAGVIAGTTTLAAPNQAVFTPAAPLQTDARYYVLIDGATDPTGNRQVAGYNVSFWTTDTTPPVTTDIRPVNGTLVTDTRPPISFSVDAGVSGGNQATGRMWLDGVLVPSTASPVNVIYNPPAPLSQGTHTVQATITDFGGNVANASWSFTIDSIAPPVPVLTGVVDGAHVSGSRTLGASSTDATSGVVRYEVTIDGFQLFNLTGPGFSAVWNTVQAAEGPRVLRVRAVDAANNTSAYSDPLTVIVDNYPLTMTFNAPAANSRFGASAPITTVTSEKVDHVTVTAGTTSVSFTSTATVFTGSVPLSTVPGGSVDLIATAYGFLGEVFSVTRTIVVDHTPPPPPNAALINAAPPANGVSTVVGSPFAVEAGAAVRVTHVISGATATTVAGADGSFALTIAAAADDSLSIVASDDVGNQGAPTLIAVRRTTQLPPPPGTNTSLTYDGDLADRVGAATNALTADGTTDATFTLTLSIGSGITRVLSSIDLVGPSTRSTRVGAGGALGVATDLNGALLNNADGTVGFPITSGTTLRLLTNDAGFIRSKTAYTATAVFSDGSRFVGVVMSVGIEDALGVPYSAVLSGATTVAGTPVAPGTSVVTISDIRDIAGNRVADGFKIAVSVANGASQDPRGGAIPSAGGAILDGTPAPNNASFRLFTVLNGQATVTYSTGALNPTALSGALSVLQVQAADAAGNLMGTRAIASVDINVRQPTDRALVTMAPTTVYADGTSRISHLTIAVRNADGTPMADGSKVSLTVGNNQTAGTNSNLSFGGSLLCGVDPANTGPYFRVVTVSGGLVTCDYTPGAAVIGTGVAPPIAVIQVANANAGNQVSGPALGSGVLTLIGAGSAEFELAAPSVAAATPFPSLPFRVRQVHDLRGGLVPDGAKFTVTAQFNATRYKGSSPPSIGGTVTGGASTVSSARRIYTLGAGQFAGEYAPSAMANPGSVQIASLQMQMANAVDAVGGVEAVAVQQIAVVSPNHAIGTATPSVMLADGAAHVGYVNFRHIIDAYGNLLPDGAHVVVSFSGPGTLLDGAPLSGNPFNYRAYTTLGGAINATYSQASAAAATGTFTLVQGNYVNGAEGTYTLTPLGTTTVTLVTAASPTLSVTVTSPAANTVVRDSVIVTAKTTGTVDRVTFSAGTSTVAATAAGSVYTATVPLTSLPEGVGTVFATAYTPNGTTQTGLVQIVVDRTPPLPPDGTRIQAAYPPAGVSVVEGQAGAVEANATVRATNTANSAVGIGTALADGSFTLNVHASPDDVLSIVAIDSVANQSLATLVNVPHNASPLGATDAVVDPLHPLAAGLAGLFLMNEGTGSSDRNLVDDQVATLAGTALPIWSADPAVVFAGGGGLNSYLNAGADLAFDQLPTSKMTVVAKMYVNTVSTAGIAEKNDGNTIDSGFVFGFDTNGALRFLVEKATGNVRVASPSATVTAGRWMQVAATFDGTIGNASTAHLFVNGVETAKTVVSDSSGLPGYANATNKPFRIGTAASFETPGSLNGKIAYLAVYKGRTLTGAELQSLDAQLPITTADLVGPIEPNSPAVVVTPAVTGQHVQLTFTAAVAQAAGVQVTGNTLGTVTVSLLRQDRTVVSTVTSAASAFTLPPMMLSIGGVHTVQIVPAPSASGSIGIAVTLADNPARPAAANLDGASPLATSLAGLFLMNEATGTTDRNLVTNQVAAFAGTSAPPQWDTSGPFVNFRGGAALNSYMDAGTDPAFDQLPTSRVTIVTKVFVTAVSAAGIVEKTDNNTIDSGLIFGWDGSGAMRLLIEKTSTNLSAFTAGGTVIAGRWMQLAVTWDGTVGTQSVAHFFLNGVEVGRTSVSDGAGTIGYANATNKPLRIGNAPFSVGAKLRWRDR